jgi:hypothetical protein
VETDTLGKAGASAVGIRSTVGDPQTKTVAKGALVKDILAAPQGDGAQPARHPRLIAPAHGVKRPAGIPGGLFSFVSSGLCHDAVMKTPATNSRRCFILRSGESWPEGARIPALAGAS